MSWGEVKKINSDMETTLDELLTKFLSTGYRKYIYENTTYVVPKTGIYTLRAYCGIYGSYGKVFRKFKKGEILTIAMTNYVVTITSNLHDESVFSIKLSMNSEVNSTDVNGLKGLAIGGSRYNGYNGGNAIIRADNGIASGGGGSAQIAIIKFSSSGSYNAYKGGNAYAYGNNVYALGGGGAGLGQCNALYVFDNSRAGLGGNAFINDVEITDYCSTNNSQNLKSGRGYAGAKGSSYYNGGKGGNGGCGGSFGYNANYMYLGSYFGDGYFSQGANTGGSSKGGECCNGYFAGGNGINHIIAGTGGFYGGLSYNSNGGYSPYGIGGDVLNPNDTNNTYKGGDGKIKGGDGYVNLSKIRVNGGNGYYPGRASAPTVYNGSYFPGGSDGMAIKENMIISTAPRFDKNKDDSIVIIEMGESEEDF